MALSKLALGLGHVPLRDVLGVTVSSILTGLKACYDVNWGR